MSLHLVKRFSLKLAAEDRPPDMPRAVVPVFHRWIRDGFFAGIVPIDVADYSHVHRGPGVLLVGHHGDFGLGDVGGVFGLTYVDKRPGEEGFPARLAAAHARLLAAARQLEEETGLRFRREPVEARVLDRLHDVDDRELQAALAATPAPSSRA